MKITKVRTRMMGVPGPGRHAGKRNWIFVFVETDAGITGVGEATTEWHEHAVVAMIEHHFGPALIGTDPTQGERLWQMMYRGFWWRGGVVASSAMSGIDQALWDIRGKACGQPVYKLLGGPCRERVRLYARHDLGLENYADEAKEAIKEGFDAFKAGARMTGPFDERRQIDLYIEQVQEAREVVGPGVDLMLDCGGQLSVNGAMRLIAELKPLRMLFVEEPINADTPAGLLRLRRAELGVDIAAGERLCTRWAFREWFEQGAIDVCQADVSHCGGISELMKIAHHAEIHGIKMAPHNPYGPVAMAASVHAAAAMPNFLILEHCRLRPWFDKVQMQGPKIYQGQAEPSDNPGLGVEIDENIVEAHPPVSLSLRSPSSRNTQIPMV